MRAELEVFCEDNGMVSAMLHMQKLANSKQAGGQEADLISTMYRLIKKMKRAEEKEGGVKPHGKEDIFLLSQVDSQKKYEIEKSHSYIAYKLLWIMKMYLEGRQFPYGSLSQEQWKRNTLKIAEQLLNKEFVNDMLLFDAGCFLEVMQRLFYGEPYWFIDRVRTQTDKG